MENNIDDIINSLNGLQTVDAKPFLATRVKAKLNSTISFWDKCMLVFNKPTIALACIVCIVVLNMMVVLQYDNKNNSTISNEDDMAATSYEVATIFTNENNNENEK